MKNLLFKVIAGAALALFFSGPAGAREIYVEDFNEQSFEGYLGAHGPWRVDEKDPTGGAEADFVRTRDGYALKLSYSVDSAISYFFGPVFIQDYSEFTILGTSDGMPHMVPCGYYFLLGETDLRRKQYLVFSARGDERAGFTRRFHIEIKTAERVSRFLFEGLTSSWRKYALPLDVFDGIDDWSAVTELTIVFNEHVTAERGVIYLDDIYFVRDPALIPEPSGGDPGGAEDPLGDYTYFTSLNLSSNYRHTPERGGEIFSSAESVIQGRTGGITGRVRARAGDQEFGSAAYRVALDEYPYTRFESAERSVTFPTLQLKTGSLGPLASRVTAGHLFLGYSQYLFNPHYGWKGLKVEGARDIFDHSTFIIKQQLNSFAAGSRSYLYLGDHRLQLLGVYDYETAALDTSEGRPGTLTRSSMDIRKVSDEFSWKAGMLFRFLDYRMNLEFNYADFRKRRHAEADYDNPEFPLYSDSADLPDTDDNMYEARLFLNGIPAYGSKLFLSYREIGTDFTPAYRQEPGIFEEVFADQRGVLVRGEQWYNQFGLRLWYDRMTRISDSDYFRDVTSLGLLYRGPRDMELSLMWEDKEEKYEYLPRNLDLKHTDITSIIFAGNYNFLYADTPGIRLPLTMTLEFRQDRVNDRVENKKQTEHSLRVGFDYRLRADLGFSAFYNASTRDNPDDLTDNAFNVFISGTFH